jgi:hypothetical protein
MNTVKTLKRSKCPHFPSNISPIAVKYNNGHLLSEKHLSIAAKYNNGHPFSEKHLTIAAKYNNEHLFSE